MPSELRNRIYEFVLTIPGTLYFYWCPERNIWLFINASADENVLAISQTCKAIHSECCGMYFALNSFEVAIHPMPTRLGLTSFLDYIGPFNATSLRSVVIDVGRFDFDGRSSLIQAICMRLNVDIPEALATLKDMAEKHEGCHFKLTCNLTPFDLMPIQLLVSDYSIAWDALLQQVQHIRKASQGQWAGLDWLAFLEYFVTRKLSTSRQQAEERLDMSLSQKKTFGDVYEKEIG